jgi:hypothetical protein
VELRARTNTERNAEIRHALTHRRRGNRKAAAAAPARSLPCGRPFWRALETGGGGDLNLRTRWRRRGRSRKQRSIYLWGTRNPNGPCFTGFVTTLIRWHPVGWPN